MKEFFKSIPVWVPVVVGFLAIVCIVLWFVFPKFCYAASAFLIGALAGFIGGYFIGKKAIVQPKEEKPVEAKKAPKNVNAPRKPHW